MSLLLGIATAAVFTLSSSTDTTVMVPKGTRLSLDNYGGEIVVDTWTKNAVRVRAEHSSKTVVEANRSESVLEIEASSRHGAPTSVDYHLTVPAWMPLELSGVYTDIRVEGVNAEVRAETVKGEVKVTGGRGVVEAQSVEGSVTVRDAQGKVELNAVNDDVNVWGVTGELTIEAINGDVHVENASADLVEISTVNGTIDYAGEIRRDGHYAFSTHNGDITIALPQTADASVSVSTFSGDFYSSFPITMSEARRGKEFNFTLGKGSAEVSLESFQGTITLRRPGESTESVRDQGSSRSGRSGTTTTRSKTKSHSNGENDENDEE